MARYVRSNVVSSQIELHQTARRSGARAGGARATHGHHPGGGSRVGEADLGLDEIDAIAVTRGPGLAGSLLVGANFAKTIAYARSIPLVGVNHLEAHLYANWLATSDDEPAELPEFPRIGVAGFRWAHRTDAYDWSWALYTSGTHAGRCRRGSVRQGRAPAGARLSGWSGDPDRRPPKARSMPFGFRVHGLARAMTSAFLDSRPHCFGRSSRSGCQRSATTPRTMRPSASTVLPGSSASCRFPISPRRSRKRSWRYSRSKTASAAQALSTRQVVLAGGVAANRALRERLASEVQTRSGAMLRVPALAYCTDNAAMVAAAGYFALMRGGQSGWELDVASRLPIGGTIS